MANEARITTGLQVIVNDAGGVLNFTGGNQGFQLNVTGRKGPCPGAVAIAVEGTDIDLSELADPGLCWMMNQDHTNFVTYGIKDFDTGIFYPLGELPPGGKPFQVLLSRLLYEEYPGTGTGEVALQNTLHMKANSAPCNVLVMAFER